jgi:hypothetical protein
VKWINLAQDMEQRTGSCEFDNKNLSSIKGGEFLD